MKKTHNPVQLAILEPKLSGHKLPKLARRLNMVSCMHGNPTNTQIWLLWNKDIMVQSFYICDQAITVSIQFQPMHFSCHASFDGCTKQERRSLWDNLLNISYSLTGSCREGGNFHIVADSHEKAGGAAVMGLSLNLLAFNNWLAVIGW